jgi:hypothetical protein
MAACPVGVTFTLEVCDTRTEQLKLWPARDKGGDSGSDKGGEVVCVANAAIWAEALSPQPAVGYQSFGALRRQTPGFRMQGHELHWAQALPVLERLLQAMRSKPEVADNTNPRFFDALAHVRGKYVQLGTAPDTWAYSEACGEGPPLLMLHTAGADARQWHGLMAQAELRQAWRMLAFDVPGHGRSPLPAGHANWTWQLDQDQYINWVLHYLDAMKLEKVVLMGCSMGSAISLPLLARHPDRFVGAVLLEAPYHSPGRRSPFLNHAQVHGGRLSAAWVGALLSPNSPASGRDHATWIYSQSAPSVYDGDLAFYSDQFNAHHHTAAIDTHRTPLWLLTGNYDYSATPADTQRVADEIPGCHFQEMPCFGHFPMVENPDGLVPFLRAPLADLHARVKQGAL